MTNEETSGELYIEYQSAIAQGVFDAFARNMAVEILRARTAQCPVALSLLLHDRIREEEVLRGNRT